VASQTMTWSDEVYRIHGMDIDETAEKSHDPVQRSIACYDPLDRPRISAAFENCVSLGIPYDLELRFISETGEHKWVHTMAKSYLENGKVVRIAGNIMDITENKRAEEKLRASETRFRTLTELLPVGVYLTDKTGSCQFANNKWLQIAGLTFEETQGDGWGQALHPEDRTLVYAAWDQMVASRGNWGMEYRFITPEGVITWVYGLATAMVTETGEISGYVGANMDITELKNIQNSLQSSLAEQEVLLREVHHRVKNNLASILGLLEMERQTTTDPTSVTLLMELGNRIKSMSTIHEKLYRSASLSRIDFADYLRTFITHLRTSMNPGFEIITRQEAEGVDLSLDLAVPCGLIVNELVTNALKYAFPQGKPGVEGAKNCEILVKMSVKGTAYSLSVADNGVGFPSDLDWRHAKTLGLRLITMLGEHQLGGKVSLDRKTGTKFTLKFDPRHRE
jgi:PAS domain S-box-containing protein